MAKIPFETKAVVVVAQQLKYRDDANPDVGMGPSMESFVKAAAELLELSEIQYDRSLAVSLLTIQNLRSR